MSNLDRNVLFDPPPENVLKIDREVRQICRTGYDIRIEDVAPLVGMNPATLRKIIIKGNCPFGFGLDRTYYPDGTIKEQGIARVQVLPFYNFMTQNWVHFYKMFDTLFKQTG